MEKQPELFPVEKLRLRNGQFANERQKKTDERIHNAKIIELQNASLRRQLKNKDYLIEILENKIKKLQENWSN